MEIIVKESKHKVDPKDPEHTDPTWEKAFRKGQRRIEQNKFPYESPGEESDYMRKVNSNPGNVPGMPEFFPPLEIRSDMASIPGHAYCVAFQRSCGDKECPQEIKKEEKPDGVQ